MFLSFKDPAAIASVCLIGFKHHDPRATLINSSDWVSSVSWPGTQDVNSDCNANFGFPEIPLIRRATHCALSCATVIEDISENLAWPCHSTSEWFHLGRHQQVQEEPPYCYSHMVLPKPWTGECHFEMPKVLKMKVPPCL